MCTFELGYFIEYISKPGKQKNPRDHGWNRTRKIASDSEEDDQYSTKIKYRIVDARHSPRTVKHIEEQATAFENGNPNKDMEDFMDEWENSQDVWAEEVESVIRQEETKIANKTEQPTTTSTPKKVDDGAAEGKCQTSISTRTAGIHTKTLDVVTAYEKQDDGAVGIQRKFRYYATEKHSNTTKCAISYVFDAKLLDQVQALLESVRKGRHVSVCWYALAPHHSSPCSGLSEHPTDHYHLIVWFDDKSKAQDLAFHKRFYQWQHGSDWKSEKVKSERRIVQYIQCEPRELVELYSSEDHAKFVQHCWETRDEMQAKISIRDSKKDEKKGNPAKVNYVANNDWWVERECRPQAIVDCMIENGIRDVNRFLLWLSEYFPSKTIGSLVYNRDKARLEKEMNMQVRRNWYPKKFMEHLEGRRKQCEKLEKDGMIMSVEDSIAAAKDIVTKNGYDWQTFINNVFDVLYKKKNKINTLYFHGVSNSCKSTIAWSIINCTPNYSQGMAGQDFMYHNCANSSIRSRKTTMFAF